MQGYFFLNVLNDNNCVSLERNIVNVDNDNIIIQYIEKSKWTVVLTI